MFIKKNLSKPEFTQPTNIAAISSSGYVPSVSRSLVGFINKERKKIPHPLWV